MTKKDKKAKGPKMSTITTKSGESLKVFEDLHDFETYLKGETEDQEFDHVHSNWSTIHLCPAWCCMMIRKKIKETANSHSKKFVRHLHQHVEKHLLKDIKTAINKPELKFHDKKKQESFDRIVWNYGEETELNAKKFKVSVEVVCKHDGAMVDVDYKTEPLQPLI